MHENPDGVLSYLTRIDEELKYIKSIIKEKRKDKR